MKSMIFLCVALVFMAGIARIYMAGGLDGIFDIGSTGNGVKVPMNINAVTTDKDIVVYKWRDDEGIMHFGEAPPAKHSGVERIELKASLNVMNAVKIKKEPEVSGNIIKPLEVANPYSPQGVSEILSHTSALKDVLNQQQADQKKMLDAIVK